MHGTTCGATPVPFDRRRAVSCTARHGFHLALPSASRHGSPAGYGPVGPSSRLLSSPLLGLLSVARRIRLLARALRALVDVASRQTIGRSSSGSAATARQQLSAVNNDADAPLRCCSAAAAAALAPHAHVGACGAVGIVYCREFFKCTSVDCRGHFQRSISAASAQHQRSISAAQSARAEHR